MPRRRTSALVTLTPGAGAVLAWLASNALQVDRAGPLLGPGGQCAASSADCCGQDILAACAPASQGRRSEGKRSRRGKM